MSLFASALLMLIFIHYCRNSLDDDEDEDCESEEETSKWDQFLMKALTTSPIDSRAFRAGVIFNPLRGLTVNEVGHLRDFDNKNDTDFKDFKMSSKTHSKRIYLVDSGLSFNLPFPLTLRPQRGIELYITCDFSSRISDSTPPFRVSNRGFFLFQQFACHSVKIS